MVDVTPRTIRNIVIQNRDLIRGHQGNFNLLNRGFRGLQTFKNKHKRGITVGITLGALGILSGAGAWFYNIFFNAPVSVVTDLDEKIDQKDFDNAISDLNAALNGTVNATKDLNETLNAKLDNATDELNKTIAETANEVANYTNFVQFVDDAADLYGALNDTYTLLDDVLNKASDFDDLLTQYRTLADAISDFVKANDDLEADINEALELIQNYTNQDTSSLSESDIEQLEAAAESLVDLQSRINPDADTDYTNLIQNAENVISNLHEAAEDIAELQESIPTLPNNYSSYDAYFSDTIETLENCIVTLSTRNNGTITGPALDLMAKLNPCLDDYKDLQGGLLAKAKGEGYANIDAYVDAIENQANSRDDAFDNLENYNASGVEDLTPRNKDINDALSDVENSVDAWRNIEYTFGMNNTQFHKFYQNHSGLLPELDNETVTDWTDGDNTSNRELSNVEFTQNNAGTKYEILFRFENDNRVTRITYDNEDDFARAKELFGTARGFIECGTRAVNALNDANINNIKLFNPKDSGLYHKITRAAITKAAA